MSPLEPSAESRTAGTLPKKHHRVPDEDRDDARLAQAPVAPLVAGAQGQQAGGQQHGDDEQPEVVRPEDRVFGEPAAEEGLPQRRQRPKRATRHARRCASPNETRRHALSLPLALHPTHTKDDASKRASAHPPKGLLIRGRGRGVLRCLSRASLPVTASVTRGRRASGRVVS